MVPYHKKRWTLSRVKSVIYPSLYLLGAFLLTFIVFRRVQSAMRSARSRFDVSYLSQGGEIYELVGDDYLPDEPMPVVVTDNDGKTRWTVSLPSSQDFPLRPNTYSNLCLQSAEIAKQVALDKAHNGLSRQTKDFDYYHVDQAFMDVSEAEENGLLPNNEDLAGSWKSITGTDDKDSMKKDHENMKANGKPKVCERSLTYVMETTDAGFGKTMMGLWMSYGLAQREGRSFFIDDRYWYVLVYFSFSQVFANQ